MPVPANEPEPSGLNQGVAGLHFAVGGHLRSRTHEVAHSVHVNAERATIGTSRSMSPPKEEKKFNWKEKGLFTTIRSGRVGSGQVRSGQVRSGSTVTRPQGT